MRFKLLRRRLTISTPRVAVRSAIRGLQADVRAGGQVRWQVPVILRVKNVPESETASVTGLIHAGHVIINGRVLGPVHASELLELQPKANIEGDVSYRALEMHQGAVITGQLRPLTGAAGEKPTLKLAANSD